MYTTTHLFHICYQNRLHRVSQRVSSSSRQ